MALLAGVPVAQAATVSLNAWTYGNGSTVNTQQPAYSGAAGGFSGALDGVDVLTYCVELTQQFNWNTSYTNYTDKTALAYFQPGSDKAMKLAKLVSYAFYDSAVHVSTAAQSTSLQLAIWNVVYDDDYTLSAGAFTDTSAYSSDANTLLTASQSFTNLANVWVLASPTQQDQLHWSKVSAGRSNAEPTVPEPGTLALVAGAIGAAAVALRRRG